jgi:hypothetical protein
LLIVKAMKPLAVVFALAVLSTVASADTLLDTTSVQSASPDSGYVALGGVIGEHLADRMGGALELGVAAWDDSPVFLHAMIAGGDSGFWTHDGSFLQLRVGAEARACTASRIACVFAGIDVGYDHENTGMSGGLLADEMATVADDMIFVPRAGFELGHQIRLRTALELPLYPAATDDHATYGVQFMTSIVVAF